MLIIFLWGGNNSSVNQPYNVILINNRKWSGKRVQDGDLNCDSMNTSPHKNLERLECLILHVCVWHVCGMCASVCVSVCRGRECVFLNY